MPKNVISGYDVSHDTSNGNWLTLKTAHISETGQAVVHEQEIDLEEAHPITQNTGPEMVICGETFDPQCAEYQRALNSEHVASLEGYSPAEKEAYALSMYIHDKGIQHQPQLVSAMEVRDGKLEDANPTLKEDLCSAPHGHEQKTAAIIMTQDEVYVLTNDGHMFEATEQVMGTEPLSETKRQGKIQEYVAGLEGDQEVFYAGSEGRNVAGAAMEQLTTPDKVGEEIRYLRTAEDVNQDLTHDLGMNFEMSNER